MKRRVMRQEDVAEFCRYLQGEERSQGTIETYRREIRAFAATLPDREAIRKLREAEQRTDTDVPDEEPGSAQHDEQPE